MDFFSESRLLLPRPLQPLQLQEQADPRIRRSLLQPRPPRLRDIIRCTRPMKMQLHKVKIASFIFTLLAKIGLFYG